MKTSMTRSAVGRNKSLKKTIHAGFGKHVWRTDIEEFQHPVLQQDEVLSKEGVNCPKMSIPMGT